MTGVTKSFGGNCVLSDVSLSLWPHEVHALVGENGAGKSTLMKILNGVYTRDSGSILCPAPNSASPARTMRARPASA
jgi:ribose transport system ATP-binding protein